MRKLMNQWILMTNFNTSGYIDMETRFMYLSHSVFFSINFCDLLC